MTFYVEEENWEIVCPNCEDDLRETVPLVKIVEQTSGLLQRKIVVYGFCNHCGVSIACPYVFDENVEDENDLFPLNNN